MCQKEEQLASSHHPAQGETADDARGEHPPSVARACPPLCHPMAPLSLRFSGQEYWNVFHFLLQGIYPTKGSKLCLQHLLHWQADSLSLSPLGFSGSRRAISISTSHQYMPPFIFFRASRTSLRKHLIHLVAYVSDFEEKPNGNSECGSWTRGLILALCTAV